MKRISLALCAPLLLLSSLISHAQNNVYAGATVGITLFDYDDVDPSGSIDLIIGFNASENIAIEASLFDSGDADVTSLSSTTLSTDGLNISVLYLIHNPKNSLTAFVGAGYYNFDTTVKAFGGETSIDASGLSLKLGAHYAFNEHFALRADTSLFVGVDDFADNESVQSFQLGGVFLF